MKPNWDEAPEWAGWLAMDGDGWWRWWRVEPSFEEEWDQWDCPGVPYDDDGVFTILAAETPDCSGEIDWDHASDTLEPRPEIN